MELSGHIKESFSNLISSKMRSLLTILGVLVGTASVVALVSGGELATRNALAQFKALGTNLLSVSISSRAPGKAGGQVQALSLTDVNIVAAASPDIILAAPYTTTYSPIDYRGKQLQGSILGATESLAKVVKIHIAQGRFVTQWDKQAFYCVVGDSIAKKMRQAGGFKVLGEQVLVGKNYFTVIGIAKPWTENMFMYASINNALIIPIGTSMLLSKYAHINNVVFRLKKDSDIDAVQKAITNKVNDLVKNQHLYFRSAKQLLHSMQKQRQTLTLLLGLIGSISLVVGGIGVMNIMLVSVIERRREIGIRMAVGAKRRDIQLMFLTESVLLTLFGGTLGIIIGEIISFATAEISRWGFHLFILPPLAGFIVSALVGIFFGFYPARKASQLDPIQTLRSE